MKTAILLDAGGVLLDETEYEAIVSDLIIDILRQLIGPYSKKEYVQDLEESIYRFSPDTPGYVLWKRLSPDLAQYQKAFIQYKENFTQNSPKLKLFDGVDRELIQLKGNFKLILAGQYGKALSELLEQKQLLNLFENDLTQDAFNITKPDPRYLEQIANRAGVNTGECIMVGDRIDKDVIPGRQNKMATVFMRTGIYKNQTPRTPNEIPDLTLESVKGMAEAIITRWSEKCYG